MSNPIISSSAEEFLFFYAIVCAATVAACRCYVWLQDHTWTMLPPAIPEDVDAYELAYMQGGENELTRAIIVGLAERGYLRATEKGIERTEARPAALAGVEQTVYDWFSTRRSAGEVFEGDLPHRVNSHCLGYEERLQQEQLVSPATSWALCCKAALWGGLAIAGIGMWRLVVGILREEPVGFLIFMGFAGFVILILTCSPDRLTARGRAFVARLRQGFGSLSYSTGSRYALVVAVLGISALASTPFEIYKKLFEKGQSSSSGGCGDGGCGGCGGCGG
jgi:uncharacterized protein (TIGR04222 family)